MKKNIPVGTRYGMLTVVREIAPQSIPCGQRKRRFVCLCDCGKEAIRDICHLRKGGTRSCGCLRGEFHGQSHQPLYNVWSSMKRRCYGSTSVEHYYRDKGIRVCDEWRESFTTFWHWALANGWKRGLDIDRIDGNGNYEPDNCRFVTRLENNLNKKNLNRVDYHGKTVLLSRLIRETVGMHHYAAVRGRIERGWTIEQCVDIPIQDIGCNHVPR